MGYCVYTLRIARTKPSLDQNHSKPILYTYCIWIIRHVHFGTCHNAILIYIYTVLYQMLLYTYIYTLYILNKYIYIYTNISNIFKYYIHIRRPRPSPRPGRRLGPPEVWILSFLNPCHAQRCRQKPPQGHSNGSRAPHGRSNGFFYRRSRLPFARPQTLQTFQLLGKGAPISPTRATPAGKSHHKATAMAQEHPTAAAMASYRRSRLPGLKPSKPSKSPPSSAGKRYPNKLNTRHARRQKPPQGHSNGSRAPPGRSNGYKGLL